MTQQSSRQSKDSARISAPSSAMRGGYSAKSRPLLIWASLPCTGGCSWQHINILTNREKVEDHHTASSRQALGRAGRCTITLANQAGVRKDLPIEIVFETVAVLRHAYLFETASKGVLCRPGSTILYIRDSIKDKILYSRPIETPASDAAARMDDTSLTQVAAVTQSASASTDLAVIPEEPRLRPTTNLEFPCPKCQNNCVGQFYCGKSTEPLRDLAHSNVRRTVQMARLRAVNEICARSGMAPSSISVEHIRGSQSSDISQRGLLSLDAESTQTAKKQMRSALNKSVLDRFTNDVAFALRSTERGLTRSAMLVQDAIATAVLPNPGRSSEQRTMGVGAQGSMQYGAGANAASTARLLFLRDEPAALLKASLITSMTDPTMAVS